MKPRDHTSCRGFSFVELLIVVAIIGLITAIAIPNLLNAIKRSRQTRSINDLRTISNGLSIYHQDVANFPRASSLDDLANISDVLIPYIGTVPVLDGWSKTFQYKSDGNTYTLCSLGDNFIADMPWENGFTSHFDEDIVILNGFFLQIPEGSQN